MTPAELKARRERLGLSQAGLARLLPVSVDTLQNWEQGLRKIPSILDRALRDLERERAAVVRARITLS